MYTKIVRTGAMVEIYEYEKEPLPVPVKRKKRKYKGIRLVRNVSRARATLYRLIVANLGKTQFPAFMTLTMRDVVPVDLAWKDFSRFIGKLRILHKEFKYVAVPEFQKRGAVHFHVLVWGLSDEEIVTERVTRRIANLWGRGFLDVLRTDGHFKLAGYLTKYMLKASFDKRYNAGAKLYSTSRNMLRPVSFTSQASVTYIKNEISGVVYDEKGVEITVDKPVDCVENRIYDTMWLGRCHYKKYLL